MDILKKLTEINIQTLVPVNDSKVKTEKCKGLRIKIRYLIRSKTKNFDGYDENIYENQISFRWSVISK